MFHLREYCQPRYYKKLWFILLLLVVSVRVFIALYTNSIYRGSVADDAYYIAVADSLLLDGQGADITTEPAGPVRSSQWGIIILYSIFRFLGLNFVEISILTLALGAVLHISTYWPLKQLLRELKIPEHFGALILIVLFFIPAYYDPILAGRTESFFFPLIFWWLANVNKLLRSNSWKFYVLYFIASVSLYAFRMQGMILFFALLMVLFIHKSRLKFRIFSLTSISIGVVLGINYLLFGNVGGPGEQKVTSGIMQFDLISFKNAAYQIIMMFGNSTDETSIVISPIVVIVSMVTSVIYTYRNKCLWGKFLGLIVIGSFGAFWIVTASYSDTAPIRYISYVAPLLLIMLLGYLNNKNISLKYILMACFFLIFSDLKVLQSDLRNLSHVRSKNSNSYERFYKVQEYLQQSEGRIYGINIVNHPVRRLIYATTGKKVILSSTPSENQSNDYYVLKRESGNGKENCIEITINNTYTLCSH